MRKLAERAGMRLSNVQYYFKSRDDVLKAMVARYFDECTDNLLRLTQNSDARTMEERVRVIVRAGLSQGQEISDMCRAFREIWAISSRNALIDSCLMEYYRSFADMMGEFAFPASIDDSTRARLKTLLLTFFEGYSITGRAVPLDTEEVVEMLTAVAMAVSEPGSP